jgi:hypothetical protein
MFTVPAFDVVQHGYSDILQHCSDGLMLNNRVCNEYPGRRGLTDNHYPPELLCHACIWCVFAQLVDT